MNVTPYLIAGPDYFHNSAGVRALHFLAKHLNERGYPAYVFGTPGPGLEERALYKDEDAIERLLQQKPIVIYPEVIPGNPLKAERVARYILNIPGLLGGNKAYDRSEMLVVWDKELEQYLDRPAEVLQVPVIERNVFNDPRKHRQGTVFWTGKDQRIPVFPEDNPVPGPLKRITYQWPETREGVAGLLQEAEWFWCWDNYTTLVEEARLCGCPVVLIPDGRFTRQEWLDHGWSLDGIAWGKDKREMEHAKETVALFREAYMKKVQAFDRQLDRFIEITQSVRVGATV